LRLLSPLSVNIEADLLGEVLKQKVNAAAFSSSFSVLSIFLPPWLEELPKEGL